MVVSAEKLNEIVDRVIERLAQANADGSLHDLLVALGLHDCISEDDDFDLGEAGNYYGDILILGALGAKKHQLQSLAEECGYSKDRLEFVEYNELKRFNCKKLQYSTQYAAIICGPEPHKAGNMGDTSSIIEALRHEEDGYPPMVECRVSGGAGDLKITKTNFRGAIADLESRKAIRQNL